MTTLDSDLWQHKSIRLRDNTGRSRYALIVFWILLGVTLISLVVHYLHQGMLIGFKNGENLPMQAVATNYTHMASIKVVVGIAYILAAIFFISWFRRAYYNLHQLHLDYLSRSEGWAAGCWFIPIVNLYLPYTIMREIWDEIHLYIHRSTKSYPIRSSLIVVAWWFLFLVSNIATNIASFMQRRVNDIDKMIMANEVQMVAMVLGILGMLLAMLLIRKTSRAEDDLRKVVAFEEEQQINALHSGKENSLPGDEADLKMSKG